MHSAPTTIATIIFFTVLLPEFLFVVISKKLRDFAADGLRMSVQYQSARADSFPFEMECGRGVRSTNLPHHRRLGDDGVTSGSAGSDCLLPPSSLRSTILSDSRRGGSDISGSTRAPTRRCP